MRTSILLLLTSILFGCGGSLSDEQRKQMRENMEAHKILRVTEVEITEAAFAEGRAIADTLHRLKYDSARLDSFLGANKGRVRYLRAGTSDGKPLEQQLLNAYVTDESGLFQDNVQKLRDRQGDFDSLLYTMPVTKKMPDSSKVLDGVWNIWLSKKELILAIGRNK